MSAENGSATKVGSWTADAKYDFLMHIIAVTNENKAIPWSKINIPGRTTKSLQNMWTKINKDLAEMRATAGYDGETPTKATPRKRGPNKKAAVFDDNTEDTPTKSKKRAAPASSTPSKRAKKEESGSEGSGDLQVKSEEDSDVGV